MKKLNKKGFTIVELVIVIAVIAILAAVLIPVFSNVVEQAQKVAIDETLSNAYTQYAIEEAQNDYKAKDAVVFEIDDAKYQLVNGEYVAFTGNINDYTCYKTVADNVYVKCASDVAIYQDATNAEVYYKKATGRYVKEGQTFYTVEIEDNTVNPNTVNAAALTIEKTNNTYAYAYGDVVIYIRVVG